MEAPVVELRHITKRFAKVLANDDVSLSVGRGEVVALLGENGAGKSTIMKILYGLYHETSGEIRVDGVRRRIRSPKDAMALGISMIQQHFSLVDAHTVTENIILGTVRGRIDYAAEEEKIQRLSDRYHFGVPAGARVRDLPVGIQQKVEILKALHRNARILIMDEPTAVLLPQEIETLMQFIRSFAAEGNSVIFITHKMKEVMEVADRIIIMRNGRISGEVEKTRTSTSELARLMIGHDLEALRKESDPEGGRKVRLEVRDLTVQPENGVALLDHLSFDLHAGEILGVAGVSGNGQQELCEALYGALPPTDGTVRLDGTDVTRLDVGGHIRKGVGYCASDRYRYGMVPAMSLSENMILKASRLGRWDRHGFISWRKVDRYTAEQIRAYQIKAPDPSVTAGSLSGGNQQKLVVGRELDKAPRLLFAVHPVRGVDIGATQYIHEQIVAARDSGCAVVLVSTELDEIMELSDRIGVIYEGEILGEMDRKDADYEKIGLLMAGKREEAQAMA